ncbi:hypothetical protein [Microscilla marina]|uniref:Uncharacterized protein n=1 Tax=Microscilla marina ATCC 23134 TaxID=313606 RepID=A1ZJY3_MICM2|nr:hypothetical protein [Microscilla marina]EAY29436.1 hypothetical protein M23134_01496 [Microscilla marina ATCC 23134]
MQEFSGETSVTLAQLSSPQVWKSIPGINAHDDQLANISLGSAQEYQQMNVEQPMDYLAMFPSIIFFESNDPSKPQLNREVWEQIQKHWFGNIKDTTILEAFRTSLYAFQLEQTRRKNGQSKLLQRVAPQFAKQRAVQQKIAGLLNQQLYESSKETTLETAKQMYMTYLTKEVLGKVSQDFEFQLNRTKVEGEELCIAFQDSTGQVYDPVRINLYTGEVRGPSLTNHTQGGLQGEVIVGYQKAVNYLKSAKLPTLPQLMKQTSHINRKAFFRKTSFKSNQRPREQLKAYETQTGQQHIAQSLPDPLPLQTELQQALVRFQGQMTQSKLMATMQALQDSGGQSLQDTSHYQQLFFGAGREITPQEHPALHTLMKHFHYTLMYSSVEEIKILNKSIDTLHQALLTYHQQPHLVNHINDPLLKNILQPSSSLTPHQESPIIATFGSFLTDATFQTPQARFNPLAIQHFSQRVKSPDQASFFGSPWAKTEAMTQRNFRERYEKEDRKQENIELEAMMSQIEQLPALNA